MNFWPFSSRSWIRSVPIGSTIARTDNRSETVAKELGSRATSGAAPGVGANDVVVVVELVDDVVVVGSDVAVVVELVDDVVVVGSDVVVVVELVDDVVVVGSDVVVVVELVDDVVVVGSDVGVVEPSADNVPDKPSEVVVVELVDEVVLVEVDEVVEVVGDVVLVEVDEVVEVVGDVVLVDDEVESADRVVLVESDAVADVTEIWADAVYLPEVAVIVALPLLRPCTTPEGSTVTFEEEEVQATDRLMTFPLRSLTTAVSWRDWPASTVAV